MGVAGDEFLLLGAEEEGQFDDDLNAFRLRRYGVFDIGRSREYFDDAANAAIV